MISIDSKAYEPLDSFAIEYAFQATFVYLLGAVKDFLLDIFKYGLKTAWRLFRFRISPQWLKHLASDRYLS